MAIGSAVGGGIDIAGALGAFNPPTPFEPNYQGAFDLGNAVQGATDANQQQLEYNNLFGAPATTYRGDGSNFSAAATPGTLSMMTQAQPSLTRLATNQESALRAADIGDMQSLSPELYQMMGNYNPQATGLMSTLDNQAQQQLNTNGGLTPAQQHQLQQQIRDSQAARGMGEGAGSAADEAYYMFNNQQQLRSQNQQFAGNTLGQEQNLYGSPMSVLGMPTAQVPGLNFSQPNPNAMNNADEEVSNLFNTNYNADLAQQAGAWQTQQKYLSGLTSGGGGSGGGMGGMMGGGGSGGGGGGGMGSMASMAMMFI